MTRAAVVGCGIMGSGITFVARAAGFPVTAVEPTDELVAAARERVERHEAQARKRNAELGELAPLEVTTDVAAAVAAADVVVEAVPEDLDLKRDVFGTLGAAAGADLAACLAGRLLSHTRSAGPALLRLVLRAGRLRAISSWVRPERTL